MSKKKRSAKGRKVAVLKPPRPRCPNAACRARAQRRRDNACQRCGTPYSPAHAARADKALADRQAAIPGSAEQWRRIARDHHDPAERERRRAEAVKAAQAEGASAAAHARMLLKASGAPTLEQAWLAETDPRAQDVLRGLLRGRHE